MNAAEHRPCLSNRRRGHPALISILTAGLLAGASASSQPGGQSVPAANPFALPASAPGFKPADGGMESSLAAAKLAEEGDGELERALERYREVVQAFVAQRPAAAEALFRMGEIQRRLGRIHEAGVAYARVVREFTDLPEIARPSLQRLQTLPVDPTAPRTQSSEGPSPAHAPSPVAPPPGASVHGVTFSLRPQPPHTTDPVVAGPAPDPTMERLHDEIAKLDDEIQSLRGEVRSRSAETRQIALQLRAAKQSTPLAVPPRFIGDNHLMEMIERLQSHEAETIDAVQPQAREEAERRAREQSVRVAAYFNEVYVPRLEASLTILEEEIDGLNKMIADLAHVREGFKDQLRHRARRTQWRPEEASGVAPEMGGKVISRDTDRTRSAAGPGEQEGEKHSADIDSVAQPEP